MAKVTGIGGVFFKSEDPEKLYAWYEKYLGITRQNGYVAFLWQDDGKPVDDGMTTWSLFPKHTGYFAPSTAPFMINYRVDDLDGILAAIAADGLEASLKREDSEYGKFAWISDPEGNRIELWEPPK